MTISRFLIIAFLVSLAGSAVAQKTNPENQPEELGKVSWYRDYDEALQVAGKEKKPVLILFQEVPGCATCRNYGQNVLSNPLMTEVIENLFVPLTIFNNKGGKDREVLDKYGEPSWNNPVVRIVSSAGWDLTPRIAGKYNSQSLYTAMEKVLEKREVDIPEYMKLLKAELFAENNPSLKEKYFKMYCFWSGEKYLGNSDAIISAKAGFMNGYEVVKVAYDDSKIKEGQLEQYAKKAQIFPIADNGNFRFSEKDHLYYLRKSKYQYLPLSEIQQTRINSAIGQGEDPIIFLSPKQVLWLKQIDRSGNKPESLINKDISIAWNWQSSH